MSRDAKLVMSVAEEIKKAFDEAEYHQEKLKTSILKHQESEVRAGKVLAKARALLEISEQILPKHNVPVHRVLH